jgi:hypothetical protein
LRVTALSGVSFIHSIQIWVKKFLLTCVPPVPPTQAPSPSPRHICSGRWQSCHRPGGLDGALRNQSPIDILTSRVGGEKNEEVKLCSPLPVLIYPKLSFYTFRPQSHIHIPPTLDLIVWSAFRFFFLGSKKDREGFIFFLVHASVAR